MLNRFEGPIFISGFWQDDRKGILIISSHLYATRRSISSGALNASLDIGKPCALEVAYIAKKVANHINNRLLSGKFHPTFSLSACIEDLFIGSLKLKECPAKYYL